MTERIRKAWLCTASDYGVETFFAPSAGKARTMALRVLQGLFDDVGYKDIHVRRAPGLDVKLPAPDPMLEQLSEQERHDLLHAIGGDQSDPTKAGYRSYFYTRDADPIWSRMVDLGLAYRYRQDPSGNTSFVLTDRGEEVAMSMVPEYRP